MLRKGSYPYEYMDDWEKFNEEALPEKKEFCNNVNLEYIWKEDYNRGKRIYRDLK